jgi:hypothetical protein
MTNHVTYRSHDMGLLNHVTRFLVANFCRKYNITWSLNFDRSFHLNSDDSYVRIAVVNETGGS